MNCPVCKTVALQESALEPDLLAQTCATCGGHWLTATAYEDWLSTAGSGETAADTSTEPTEPVDTPQAKLCPSCKRILARQKVGHGLTFGIDHCGACNGVWLDPGEWESLRFHGLHRLLHRIATAPWQREVWQEEHRKARQALYTERLGESDYAEIQKIRGWLSDHPHRAMLLAYLIADDPYHDEK